MFFRNDVKVVVTIVLYLSILFLCFASYWYNYYSYHIKIDIRYERLITAFSMCYFFILIIVSTIKKNFFWFILPFVILTVPNAVNSVFPGIYLAPEWDRGNASFSFISHIDIYFFTHIINEHIKKKKNVLFVDKNIGRLSWLAFFLGIVLILRAIVAILNREDYLLIINGAYQFRYLALLLLFSSQLFSLESTKLFLMGLLFSIPLLALESIVSTFLSGGVFFGELKSGNFANNVFGNLLAFLFVFFWVARGKVIESNFYYNIILTLLFIMILSTGVRGAILSTLVGFISFYFVVRISIGRLLLIFFITIILAYLIYILLDLNYLFSYLFDLSQSFQLVLEKGYGSAGISIDAENSSLITRVAIWKGTFAMAIDNWVLGIGTGQWNYLKIEYGIPFTVLLDPHNDYLNFICLYGFLVGTLCSYFFYFKSIGYVLFNKIKSENINPYYIALFSMSVSSLTNANTNKHQVFMMVAIFLVLGLHYQSKQRSSKFLKDR